MTKTIKGKCGKCKKKKEGHINEQDFAWGLFREDEGIER
jgi:hypothetical protein